MVNLVWSVAQNIPSGMWVSVAYGGGIYVAVSPGGEVIVSRDGNIWEESFVPEGMKKTWRAVAYGAGVFVVVGSYRDDTLIVSADGVSWASFSTNSGEILFETVFYANGRFVASGGTISSPFILTSINGISWVKTLTQGSWLPFAFAFGNNRFVALSRNSNGYGVYVSSDAYTWTQRNIPQNQGTSVAGWRDIAFGHGLFVAIAQYDTPRVIVSADGQQWQTISDTTLFGADVIAFGLGMFVASNGGSVYTSPDGVVWGGEQYLPGQADTDIIFADGMFVLVGSSGLQNSIMIGKPRNSKIYVKQNGAIYPVSNPIVKVNGELKPCQTYVKQGGQIYQI